MLPRRTDNKEAELIGQGPAAHAALSCPYGPADQEVLDASRSAALPKDVTDPEPADGGKPTPKELTVMNVKQPVSTGGPPLRNLPNWNQATRGSARSYGEIFRETTHISDHEPGKHVFASLYFLSHGQHSPSVWYHAAHPIDGRTYVMRSFWSPRKGEFEVLMADLAEALRDVVVSPGAFQMELAIRLRNAANALEIALNASEE